MYIKVYISGMEMSQRIHFWHQILLYRPYDDFLRKWQKNTFLVKHFSDKLTKIAFGVKNAQISGKSRKDTCLGTDFLFFILIFFEFLTKKCKKCVFPEKISKF